MTCEKIEQLLDDKTKGNNYTVVMGDFNAVVIREECKEGAYVSHYGLGYLNDHRQMLMEWKKQTSHV